MQVHRSTIAKRLGRALIGVALVCAPVQAHACDLFQTTKVLGSEKIERPTWPDWAQIVLIEEQIEIECSAHFEPIRCRWHATYVYEGSSGVAVAGWLVLSSEQHPQVQVDGEPVHVEWHNGRIRVPVPDAGRFEVEVAAEVDVQTTTEDNTCTAPAGFARHPIVGRNHRTADFVVHERQPVSSFAHTHLRVRAPRLWRVLTEPDGHAPAMRSNKLVATFPTRDLPPVELEAREFANGPFAAVGVGFGPRVRPRLRAGWQIAVPAWLLTSLAVEGDASEELLVVAAIEAASPLIVRRIPSAGIGVGAPVMLLPEPRPGIRVQMSLAWPFVGLLGTVDVYQRPGRAAVRGALLLQVSI